LASLVVIFFGLLTLSRFENFDGRGCCYKDELTGEASRCGASSQKKEYVIAISGLTVKVTL
jgi:hypothetical protein